MHIGNARAIGGLNVLFFAMLHGQAHVFAANLVNTVTGMIAS